MPRSILALIKPTLLVWARERAGFSIEDAAEKAGVQPETLVAWESGESQPTISQLRKLGEIYKRPLAVFFLPEPPKDFDAQREFRRLPGLMIQKETPELRAASRCVSGEENSLYQFSANDTGIEANFLMTHLRHIIASR